jgi:hypothetical protein
MARALDFALLPEKELSLPLLVDAQLDRNKSRLCVLSTHISREGQKNLANATWRCSFGRSYLDP